MPFRKTHRLKRYPSNKRQRGFALVATLAALVVFGMMGNMYVQESIQKSRRDAAESAGVMAAQFKQALRALIAREGAGLPTGNFTGTAWLKDSGSCASGTGTARYLLCEFPDTLPLELAYNTTVTSAGGVVTATVDFGIPSIGGDPKPTLGGRIASAINGTTSDYATPATQTYYAASNDTSTGRVTMVVTNSQENLEFVKVNGTSIITGDHDWNNFSISNLRNLGVNGTVTAGAVSAGTVNATTVTGTTINGTNFNGTNVNATTVTASRTRDSDNLSYGTDASHTSRMNFVDANLLRLNSNYAENGTCSTKVVGTTSTGELMSCVSGRWKKTGGGGAGIKSGTVGNGGYISPVSGYTRSQCVVSINGQPYEQDGSYKRARHYGVWYQNSGAGWRAYAGLRAIQSGALSQVANAQIQYQVICSS